jgi:hypothetical protein
MAFDKHWSSEQQPPVAVSSDMREQAGGLVRSRDPRGRQLQWSQLGASVG